MILLLSLLLDGAPVPPFLWAGDVSPAADFSGALFLILFLGLALLLRLVFHARAGSESVVLSKEGVDAEIERLIDAAGRKPWQ